MDVLLKHLVDITGQRDHALLDSSVVAALQELVGATQVRLHELFRFRDELYVRPRAWIQDGTVCTAEDVASAENAGEPMTNYLGLVESIKQRKSHVVETNAQGQHVLWLPIWLNDKVSTCVEVTRPTAYSANHLDIMGGILSVYRNFQSVLEYSERDSLTGLLNRKTFDEKFSKLLASTVAGTLPRNQEERRHRHATKSQWLAVVDIDHFKRVNDQFGHLYGDEVLILVANLMRSSFRAQDRVFRFGGEEFVILLRSTTLEETHMVFERFRANIERHVFPQVGKITVSIGFVGISAESPVVILGRADQALYYAKTHGRNQVCHYDELLDNGRLHSESTNDDAVFFFNEEAG